MYYAYMISSLTMRYVTLVWMELLPLCLINYDVANHHQSLDSLK